MEIEVRSHRRKDVDDVIVLVNDHRRLNDDVHEKVLNVWNHALPFDMHLHKHEEREEYSKLSSTAYRQIFKHWWSMQNLPPEVKYVIKVRNDIEFHPKLIVNVRRLVGSLRFKEEKVSIGFGTMGWDKHFDNIMNDEVRTLGDIILFHHVDCFQNPYDYYEEMCVSDLTPHHWWAKLFKGKKYQIDWHTIKTHR